MRLPESSHWVLARSPRKRTPSSVPQNKAMKRTVCAPHLALGPARRLSPCSPDVATSQLRGAGDTSGHMPAPFDAALSRERA